MNEQNPVPPSAPLSAPPSAPPPRPATQPKQSTQPTQPTQHTQATTQLAQTSGLAIGALICGVLSLLLIPTVIGAPLLATVAIILALIHLLTKRRIGGRGMSIAGLVCAMIAIAGAATLGIWAFNKGKKMVNEVTEITSTISDATGNASVLAETIENLPVDDAEAASIAKNLNTEIEAPSLEGLDIGSLLGALSNPDDPTAMSNFTALVEGLSNDKTLQNELNNLGLEGLGNTIEGLGSQFQELNELLAE